MTADDYDEAVRFYRDGLGLPERASFSSPDGRISILDPDRTALLVPPPLRPRLAVHADVALTRIAGIGPPSFSTLESLVGVPGRIIVQDPPPEESAVAAAFAALEAPDPTIAGVHLVPLLVDPALQIWVFQVPMPGASVP